MNNLWSDNVAMPRYEAVALWVLLSFNLLVNALTSFVDGALWWAAFYAVCSPGALAAAFTYARADKVLPDRLQAMIDALNKSAKGG